MQNPNILVVESDPAVRTLMIETLEDEGYAVQLLDRYALQSDGLADGPRPDLMLLELVPVGVERTLMLLRRLRREQPTLELPVLISTTDPRLLERLSPELHRLACPALLKPFDLDELLQLVREQLVAPVMRPLC